MAGGSSLCIVSRLVTLFSRSTTTIVLPFLYLPLWALDWLMPSTQRIRLSTSAISDSFGNASGAAAWSGPFTSRASAPTIRSYSSQELPYRPTSPASCLALSSKNMDEVRLTGSDATKGAKKESPRLT